MNTKTDRQEQLLLELLDAVGKKSDLNQRHLASEMGVALGLANSYLKRCIRKGWIKIRSAPANRYLYYLTPKGFAEKSRLTAKYLAYSLEFYRKAGDSCLRVYAQCQSIGWKRLLLWGKSDLAEIAALRAQEMDIEIIGVYHAGAAAHLLAGRPVWGDVRELPLFDACVLTDLVSPSRSMAQLRSVVERKRILVPDILHLD